MFNFFKEKLLNVDNLSESDLEPTYVAIKSDLLLTDYYTSKEKYNKLHDRLGSILTRICNRHEIYMIEAEAKITYEDYFFYSFRNHSWKPYTKSIINDLDLSSKSNECLLLIAWFSYIGGIIKDIGQVDRDEDAAYKIVKYLNDERKYLPSIFLRGFMYKYGLKFDTKQNLRDARLLLTKAAESGVGGAVIELRQFDIFEKNKTLT